MAFPDDRMPIRLRAAFGADAGASPSTWTWTNITQDVNAQQVTIIRGTPNEGGEPQPTSISLVLDNVHGNYTPDNPLSIYWPDIDQGLPLEYSLGVGSVHLSVDGAGGRATTPDDAALDILGDIDIRLDLELDNWGQESFLELAAKQELTTDERSWRLMQLGASGAVELVWFTDGTAGSGTAVSSTVPLPVEPGDRIAVRVTLDVDNGAGGWTLTFYTADTIAGPWTQLGDQVTGAGVTSIYNSNAPLDIGDVAGILLDVPMGRYYGLELRDGINGTLVASPDFTALAEGTTAFTDSAGRDWTVTGAAAVDNYKRRFVGHADSFEPVWPYGDLSREGEDGDVEYEGEAQVTVRASGILQRLGQGEEPLQSTLRRRIPSFSPVAYWALEEGRSATAVSSPVEGVAAFTPTGFDFASDDTLPGSSPLPTIGSPASFAASAPVATAGEWQVELVYYLEAMPGTESTLFEVRSNGTARRVRVRVATNLVRIQGFDGDESEIFNGFTTAPQFNGAWNRLQIRAVPNGGNVNYSVRWIIIGGTGFSHTQTIAGSAGYVTQVRSTFENLEGLRFGHLAVFDTQTDSPFNEADRAFDGETAATRMTRLCQEEGIAFTLVGDAADTEEMGPQRPDTLTALLTEAAALDGGILGEQRAAFGLQYRTRTSLYNQTPALILDAAQNEIVNPFAPVLDDQRLRNQVTVTRDSGSSATAVDEASVARRGLYKTSVPLNAHSDDRLPALAGWRLHLGTWPGMRYPSISAELAIAPQLIEGWVGVDYGDRLQTINLPPQHPKDTVDLLLQGYSETISPTRWTVHGNCVPAGPWTVGVVGDSERGRVDANPRGSTLGIATDDDDTQIVVHTPARSDTHLPVPWITSAGPAPTYPAEFPYDIKFGGETARVTASAPAAWDTFTRSETGQWGTSDAGFTWAENAGAASDRSVNGTAGVITLAANPATVRFQRIVGGITDTEVLVRMSVDQIATGASLLPSVLLRYTDTSNFYRARVHFSTSGNMFASVTRAFTTVGSTPSLPYTYSPGDWFWARVRLTGHRVQLRVWPDNGTREPTEWHKDETITTDPIDSGQIGLTGSAFDTNTNVNPQLRYDDFTIVTPQLMTVTRSVNGVVKAHSVGTEVRLAQPAVVAL